MSLTRFSDTIHGITTSRLEAGLSETQVQKIYKYTLDWYHNCSNNSVRLVAYTEELDKAIRNPHATIV